MIVWRVYCNGYEFGIDYPSRKEARHVRRIWAAAWPDRRYVVRRVRVR